MASYMMLLLFVVISIITTLTSMICACCFCLVAIAAYSPFINNVSYASEYFNVVSSKLFGFVHP